MEILKSDSVGVEVRTKLTLSDIRCLLELCLSKCYFLWNDCLYVIDDAGPIGLSLMVVIAEGYLQYLERIALNRLLRETYARILTGEMLTTVMPASGRCSRRMIL